MEFITDESDTVFPSVQEIKSYFPEDVWSTMAEYEQSSYRNILHNYNVMRSLGMNPKKPSFMAMYQRKAPKRKVAVNPRKVPAKKPLLASEKTEKVVKDNSSAEKNTTDSKLAEKQQKKNPVFDSSHRWKSINLHCVFSAVLEVYKKYYETIKLSQKRKSLEESNSCVKANIKNPENVITANDDLKGNICARKTVEEDNGDEEYLTTERKGLKENLTECGDKRLNVPTLEGQQGSISAVIPDAEQTNEHPHNAAESKAKEVSAAKATSPEAQDYHPKDTAKAVSDSLGESSESKAKEASAAKASSPEAEDLPKDTDESLSGSSGQSSERRYPRRAVPVVDYKEAELLQDDEYLFCDLCDREYEGDCPEHGPHKIIPDRIVPVTGDDGRAMQTTPAILQVAKSKIPGAGSGVWTREGLPGHVRFGPYQGDETSEPDPLGYSWAIVKDRKVTHYMAAHRTSTSNWMRFVNCARHESEQNLMAFQHRGQMFYRTVRPVPPKSELFVWYGKLYAELLGISQEKFRSKDTSHLRNLVFSCDKCNVTYTSPLYLEVHEKRCRGSRTVKTVEPSLVPTDVQQLAVMVDGRKTYCCNVCDYKTAKSDHMKRHMVTHSGVKPHTCDVCGKGFTVAHNLVTHKRIHTGDRPYKCDQCPYSTAVSGNLSRHKTQHSGEKVYACTECDYKTAQSCNMERHSRTHSGDRPYCCTVCSYRTADSGNLTAHMRTHTGNKPHACPHCQYRTTQKSHLNSHMARLHPDLK